MADERITTKVTSRTSGVSGRSLNAARTNHFVIDLPAIHGGPNEAPTPGEAFLAGVSACGVLLIEHFAKEAGVPLSEALASIEGVRMKSKPQDFTQVNLKFELRGVTEAQAKALVEKFKES